jgi:Thioredoxin
MISYLSPNDFFVTSNNQLSHVIHGFCVVFFTSDKCQHCHTIAPAFKAASDAIKGCTFAVMNVDQNDMQVVRMSHRTHNRLEYVPLIVMYANGVSAAIFNPDESNPVANLELLKQFISTTAAAIRSRGNGDDHRGSSSSINSTSSSSSMSGNNTVPSSLKPNDQYKVCDTSTGIAICGPRSKQVCYLQEANAYSNRGL